jgi:hypothetical protein
MKKITIIVILSLSIISAESTYSQQNTPTTPLQKSIKLSMRKVPKYSVSFMGGFSYVLSRANGDASNFKAQFTPGNGNIFTADNLGMQQGYGAMVVGKAALGKKRKFRVTGNIGYNLFYNTYDNKLNRTMWNLLNLGTGIEYNFAPKEKERLFVGAEVNYSVMFGAWQSDIIYPDNSVSNIYTKFKPASRFGLALTSGMEFRVSRKMDIVVALRGVWSNIFPKQNYESTQPYVAYMNDSGDKNGIQLNGKKDIFFIQIVTGVTLPISYK